MSVSWPEISKTRVFKCRKSNSVTMKPTFNISANLTECNVASLQTLLAAGHIWSQFKRTAMEKLMSHTGMSEKRTEIFITITTSTADTENNRNQRRHTLASNDGSLKSQF